VVAAGHVQVRKRGVAKGGDGGTNFDFKNLESISANTRWDQRSTRQAVMNRVSAWVCSAAHRSAQSWITFENTRRRRIVSGARCR
jgi:hypothetical protein